MKKRKFFFILSIFIVLISFTLIALLLKLLGIIDLGISKILFIWHNLAIISTIIMWIILILSHNYSYSKMLWLFITFLLPGWGIILYLFFARDFKTKILDEKRPMLASKEYLKYEPISEYQLKSNYIHDIFRFALNVSGRSLYQHNTKTKVLTNGDQMFPMLKEKLKSAQKYIYMTFYIIKTDQTGREVLDILKEKALEGLDVRLMYDSLGSNNFRLSKKYMKSLKKAGVKVIEFDCIQGLKVINILNRLNFRNHRKVTVIDGKYGFIGGMNLANEYAHLSKHFGFWRDTHLLVEGKGVQGLKNIFLKDWYYATGVWLTDEMKANENEQEDAGDKTFHPGEFMVVESGPDYENMIIKDIYFKMINSAKKSIKIQTPYLILEPEMLQALKTAAESGVMVEIIVPGKPDKMIMSLATESYYDVLLECGVRIYEYKNIFIHSKVMIIDDTIASIGTVNFDPRSFNLNFEATTLIRNDSVDQLIYDFYEDRNRSREILLNKWRKRPIIVKILQGLINLFSPIL